MSEREQAAFYGDDGRPFLSEMLATLTGLTGSEPCAVELVAAANEVEEFTKGAALTPMPEWIC